MKRLISQTIRNQDPPHSGIPAVVDNLQAQGRYTFFLHQLKQLVPSSDEAIQSALRRLARKGRVASPRRGFFVIVPLEYRTVSAPPPYWYIDDLMQGHREPNYYVGLLSAAKLHGAAHHQPQEFQVFASRPIRPVTIGRTRIHFLTKRHIEKTPVLKMKTDAGYIRVSTPEATALDLVRYVGQAGYFDNIATVLHELAEVMSPASLLQAAQLDVELSCIQRLGYLLDYLGCRRLTRPLSRWLPAQRPRPTPLRPDRPTDAKTARDPRWLVLINETVAPDT